QYRANNLVVPRAAAQVPRQPVARLLFARARLRVEQRLGGHDETRRADPALQRRVFEKLLLHRMQPLALGNALDGRDALPLRFRREHEARGHQPSVEDHRAGAAVARRASFLGPGKPDLLPARIEQRLRAGAEKFNRLTVNRGFDVKLGHHQSAIRCAASCAARFVSTPQTVRRYSAVPRLSSIGRAAALAAADARASDSASIRDPISAPAASGSGSAVGATAATATRAAVHTPDPSSVRLTAAPATAMSISLRGMSRRQ